MSKQKIFLSLPIIEKSSYFSMKITFFLRTNIFYLKLTKHKKALHFNMQDIPKIKQKIVYLKISPHRNSVSNKKLD